MIIWIDDVLLGIYSALLASDNKKSTYNKWVLS